MSSNVQQIERKMKMIRREIERDANQLAASATRLTNWREYVRAYPWLCVGGAVAVGALLAPSRSRTPVEDDASAMTTGSLGQSVLGLIGVSVGRAAISFGAQYVMKQLTAHARQADGSHDTNEAEGIPDE